MCSSIKQPKPERLVEMLGMPMTVHSAVGPRVGKQTQQVSSLLRKRCLYTTTCWQLLATALSTPWLHLRGAEGLPHF